MKALITGATRGIGRSVSLKLAKMGYELILISRNESDLLSLAEEAVVKGAPSVSYFEADLSDAIARKEVINDIDFEEIDVLINNLGAFYNDTIFNTSEETMIDQLEVNFFPAFALTQKMSEVSNFSGLRNVIFVGSIAAQNYVPQAVSYSLSKGLLSQYIKVLAAENNNENFMISEIIPGQVNTSSWDGIPVDKSNFIEAEEIADAVAFILSSKKSHLTQIHIKPRKQE